jgi:ribulose-phosphate 3-epimerase
MIDIIPSILVPDEHTFLAWSRAVEEVLPMIQLDIADGQFVPNETWADPNVVDEHLQIDCELHLMVRDPLKEVRLWEDVQQIKRVLVHYESNPENITEILAQIHSYGWEVGLVLNPDTPVDVVDDLVEEIDSLMLMGVIPGKQGQKFIPKTIARIKEARERFPNLYIELDGAVNEETLPDIVATGVHAICPGSSIFGNDRTPAENVKLMRDMISTLTKN